MIILVTKKFVSMMIQWALAPMALKGIANFLQVHPLILHYVFVTASRVSLGDLSY